MRNNRSLTSIATVCAGAVLFFTLVACFTNRTVTTTIRHPMQVGQIDQNRVPHSYPSKENQHGLPAGSLDDEASLVRMDAEAVCFDVKLRSMDLGNGWEDLRNWEVTMTSGEDIRLAGPTVQQHQPQVQQFNGLIAQEVQTGTWIRECTSRNRDGSCNRWEQRPETQIDYVPGIVTVQTGGGMVCFGNQQGHINTSIAAIALSMTRNGQTRNFEWEFESIVQ